MERSDKAGFGVEVVFHITQAHRRELLQTVASLRQRLAREGGAGICEVFEDSVVPNRCLWMEWWPTEQGAETSLASDRFATLQAAIRHLGRIEAVRRIDLKRELPVKHPTDDLTADFGCEPEHS